MLTRTAPNGTDDGSRIGRRHWRWFGRAGAKRSCQYDRDLHALGYTFEAAESGSYTVTADNTKYVIAAPRAPEDAAGLFAVGDNVANWMRPPEWGASMVLVASCLGAIMLAIVASRVTAQSR